MAYSAAEVTMMLFKSSNDWVDLVGSAGPKAPNMFTEQAFHTADANNDFKNISNTAILEALQQSELSR